MRVFVPEIIENVFDGIGGGDDGVSTIGEIREGLTGGCFGLLMSSAFFFFFFFGMTALFSGGISDYSFELGALALPLIGLLCVSGIASPFIGFMMGIRGGQYRMMQHLGCFTIYLFGMIAAIVAVSVLL